MFFTPPYSNLTFQGNFLDRTTEPRLISRTEYVTPEIHLAHPAKKKKTNRPKPIYKKDVPKADLYLNRVISHLTETGTLKPTLAKFRYLGLKAAVARFFASGFSDTVDYQTCFESLREFDDIQSWLDSIQLELEGRVSRNYSLEELEEASLESLKDDAKRLGVIVLGKNEYARLIANERRYFKLIRNSDGWAASLL